MRTPTKALVVVTILAIEHMCVPARASGVVKGVLHDVRQVSSALELYEDVEGVPPRITDEGWIVAHPLSEYYTPSSRTGVTNGYLVDHWGKAFICRYPGRHAKYDVYSTGANRIDDGGSGDDLSSWGMVEEGFYYKANWPTARHWIAVSVVVSLVIFVVLLARRWHPWAAIIPWLLGTFWGTRNVDVISASTATEPAPESIAMPYLAALIVTFVLLVTVLVAVGGSAGRRLRDYLGTQSNT